VLTVGVEEEFLLPGPNGAVAPAAADVARDAGLAGRIVPEYMTYQLETVSRVCDRLDELRVDLVGLRQIAARSAERSGVRLVASGSVPFAAGPLGAVSDGDRYRRLAQRFPWATEAGGTCACQVHVGVPDRDLAVAVVARIRPWLPALLALTVNSPFTADADSGWSSCRYMAQRRWPTFRTPDTWSSARRYDDAVRALIASGAAMDKAAVYFLARPSARYPTVEVRVADACLTAEDAVMYAGVVRALVASVIDDARRGVPAAEVPAAAVDAGLLAAARRGMRLRDARPLATPEPPILAVARLLAKISPELIACGDADEVRTWLIRLSQTGTGADRQRHLWARAATPREFVSSLAEQTVPARVPG